MDTKSPQKMTPVPVTRGSEIQFFSQKVDWIEGTFKMRKTVNLPAILSQKFVPCRAFNGYTVGSKFDDGRTHFQNPDRPEMGTHITWDGNACGNCPIDLLELIKSLIQADFSFTRLDLACDFINCNLEPCRATEELENGRCKTRAREYPYWGTAGADGYTQYIGKKTSEIYMRIYDKAAEMGVQQDHTRVELVVRHERADKAAREIVLDTDFRRLVVSHADFPKWDEWASALCVLPTKLPAERKTSATKEWLLRSAASALAKQMILDGEEDFYFKFLDQVKYVYRQLSKDRHMYTKIQPSTN